MTIMELLSKKNFSWGALSHLREKSVSIKDPSLDHKLAERELEFVEDFMLRGILGLCKPIDHIPVKRHNSEHFIHRSLKFILLKLPELQASKVIDFLRVWFLACFDLDVDPIKIRSIGECWVQYFLDSSCLFINLVNELFVDYDVNQGHILSMLLYLVITST
jgi:hypothetical protein